MTDTNRYYDKYKRDKNSQAFYKSKEWRDVRELALKRDNYLCVECMKQKKLKKADVVHHKLELRDHPELRSTLSNLESVCHAHHNGIHKTNSEDNNNTKVNANLYVTKTNPNIPM